MKFHFSLAGGIECCCRVERSVKIQSFFLGSCILHSHVLLVTAGEDNIHLAHLHNSASVHEHGKRVTDICTLLAVLPMQHFLCQFFSLQVAKPDSQLSQSHPRCDTQQLLHSLVGSEVGLGLQARQFLCLLLQSWSTIRLVNY